jgi:hypothetical protein
VRIATIAVKAFIGGDWKGSSNSSGPMMLRDADVDVDVCCSDGVRQKNTEQTEIAMARGRDDDRLFTVFTKL